MLRSAEKLKTQCLLQEAPPFTNSVTTHLDTFMAWISQTHFSRQFISVQLPCPESECLTMYIFLNLTVFTVFSIPYLSGVMNVVYNLPEILSYSSRVCSVSKATYVNLLYLLYFCNSLCPC